MGPVFLYGTPRDFCFTMGHGYPNGVTAFRLYFPFSTQRLLATFLLLALTISVLHPCAGRARRVGNICAGGMGGAQSGAVLRLRVLRDAFCMPEPCFSILSLRP